MRIQIFFMMIGMTFFLMAEPILANNDKTADGLKEALNVGIKAAVKSAGAVDGYFKNPDIKILLPEKLQKADKMIRSFGGGAISDTLVLKMNRAAEKAAPEAQDIFIKAIKGMQINDAMEILSSKNAAATKYLQGSSGDALKNSFYPIVKESLGEVNALKVYDEYLGKLKVGDMGKALSLLNATGLTNSGPLAIIGDIELDMNKYVTDKAINGLFTILAAEEEKIRKNPEAQVTTLLKDVFGGILSK
ncbi:MAG: DUF4197 domain-containing protein [Candidatus Electrothrix sp. GW3-4]|uniref:DUF4197 domain-containing protein n=1 Tax=Candidatus Electrothrix sp. GW3-4 TaxID=3126740 RepID=UPI0030CF226B